MTWVRFRGDKQAGSGLTGGEHYGMTSVCDYNYIAPKPSSLGPTQYPAVLTHREGCRGLTRAPHRVPQPHSGRSRLTIASRAPRPPNASRRAAGAPCRPQRWPRPLPASQSAPASPPPKTLPARVQGGCFWRARGEVAAVGARWARARCCSFPPSRLPALRAPPVMAGGRVSRG